MNNCIVIKETDEITDTDDGKRLECFTVFKGKRIWSFGLFRDPSLPPMIDKVLQEMEFWEKKKHSPYREDLGLSLQVGANKEMLEDMRNPSCLQ